MIEIESTKQCVICNEIKYISAFRWRNDTKKYRNECIDCRKQQEKAKRVEHRLKNANKIEWDGLKKCYKCGEIKDLVLFAKNITKPDGRGNACLDCDRLEKANNRIKNKTKLNRRAKERRKENPEWHRQKDKERYYANKLKRLFSVIIRDALFKRGGSKNGKSAFNLVSYSLEDLKISLQNQFEPWMTWENHGKYIEEEWNDNDPKTYKWNIDHIMPQSFFEFTCAKDKGFQDCWALSNLRPLSAKQNVKDHNRRTIEEIEQIKNNIRKAK